MKKKIPSLAFSATRLAHRLEAAQDYTEIIASLIEEKGEARTCEIATRLGISHVTALRTLRRLQNEGYIETKPRKPVYLTLKGKQLAKECQTRHRILVEYLVSLGVSRKTAEIDVEGIEHHISEETFQALKKHIKKDLLDMK